MTVGVGGPNAVDFQVLPSSTCSDSLEPGAKLEQGLRRPESTALRLLAIAKKNPAILLKA